MSHVPPHLLKPSRLIDGTLPVADDEEAFAGSPKFEECDFVTVSHPQPVRPVVVAAPVTVVAEPIYEELVPAQTFERKIVTTPPPVGGFAYRTGGTTLGIDIEKLLATRLLITASSGGGKSYLIRKLLEETHGKVTQVVIDPEGEFGTLAQHAQYRLAGGDHGDVAADPRLAADIATEVLTSGRSLIADVYDLEHDDRVAFVGALLNALVEAPKHLWRPLLVIVDEAHMFAPDKVKKLASAKPMIELAARGRKRGYACVMATQRLSKLHKDIAAECLNKLVGRTTLDKDLRRAGDEVGLRGNFVNRLRTLRPGEFYAYGPALLERPEVVTIAPVRSEHGLVQLDPTKRVGEIGSSVALKETEEEEMDAEQVADEPQSENQPPWLQRWERVVDATFRLDKGASIEAVLAEADVSRTQWYESVKNAKKHIPAEVKELYAKQMWITRKREGAASRKEPMPRRPLVDKVLSDLVAPQPQAIDGLSAATRWLSSLQGDERRHAYVALGIMVGLTESTVMLVAPPTKKGKT